LASWCRARWHRPPSEAAPPPAAPGAECHCPRDSSFQQTFLLCLQQLICHAGPPAACGKPGRPPSLSARNLDCTRPAFRTVRVWIFVVYLLYLSRPRRKPPPLLNHYDPLIMFCSVIISATVASPGQTGLQFCKYGLMIGTIGLCGNRHVHTMF
jgi:hypothetical protein